jgi:hypothetical protein
VAAGERIRTEPAIKGMLSEHSHYRLSQAGDPPE